ncbi:hypothetical protein HanRHA438_Chr14g0636931 [Helianthus annuus]|uniref:Uncharacterized protein n=1 Tax=Helianthus annuus TaxID=4232 RepID=A0A251SIH7_HELAN|nr:hypothetical protein HanXRQr2_Chr14g0627181 [Helianthus annuus]KAJ0463169.1 hypothetical protein HanHA300_Chr14g0512191 [Helianthus annuus]KAJ0467033.1 hypothetical protein HanIR_Chr14g0678741 [Helianthus annuus]KAJ0484541.1 hypothetical protein HanHA89_Chr14g0545261 [Helianthus annuus]KAJ0655096.1 hypothetical protein HanLR1_Chr14g0514551 [Helianthus annuus]
MPHAFRYLFFPTLLFFVLFFFPFFLFLLVVFLVVTRFEGGKKKIERQFLFLLSLLFLKPPTLICSLI